MIIYYNKNKLLIKLIIKLKKCTYKKRVNIKIINNQLFKIINNNNNNQTMKKLNKMLILFEINYYNIEYKIYFF